MARTGDGTRIPTLGKFAQNSAATFGTDLTELSNNVEAIVDPTVPTPTDLPASGNWVGRQNRVVSDDLLRHYTGTAWTIEHFPRAASLAIRNALYPNPVQGDRVYRTDLGYVEQYYTTAIGGATTAGWYPAPGEVVYCDLTQSSTYAVNETPLGSSGHAYVEVSDELGWHDATTNPERITPTVAGRYRVDMTGGLPVASSFLRLYKNNAGTSFGGYNAGPLGGGIMTGVGYVDMNGTTDYIHVNTYPNQGTATGTFRIVVTYLGPS